jgi:hypothetical protein
MGTKLHIFEFAFKISSLLVGQWGTQRLMTPNKVDLNFTKGPKRNYASKGPSNKGLDKDSCPMEW